MLKILKLNLFGLFLALLFLGTANAEPINARARVLAAITITENTPLNFGSFTVGSGGGIISFDAGTAISATGDIILLGGEIAGIARLDTTNTSTETIIVTVIGTTLTSGANSMDIVGNCLGVGGVLGVGNGDCSFHSNRSAAEDVIIGGTLTVEPNQPSGTYVGTLEVTTNL